MSKIIAVWGSPASGNTTFTLKLAKAIYDTYTAKIICIFPDNTSPELPVIFPNKKADEMMSLGSVLSKTDISSTDLQKGLVTMSDYKNLGFLGYIDGENKYTYPEHTKEKATALLDIAAALSDFVLVDCGSHMNPDSMSMAATEKADKIFRICSPNYKSFSFFSSQLPLYADLKYRLEDNVQVMNICDGDPYLPVQEAQHYFKNVRFTLPYVRSIRQQMLEGKSLVSVKDKVYAKVMKKIIQEVV